MFITLFNLYGLRDNAAEGAPQTSCLGGSDPLEVKLALLEAFQMCILHQGCYK